MIYALGNVADFGSIRSQKSTLPVTSFTRVATGELT
jgi:hypothetical protein